MFFNNKKKDTPIKELFDTVKEGTSEVTEDGLVTERQEIFDLAKEAAQVDQLQLMLNLKLKSEFINRITDDVIPAGFSTYVNWEQVDDALIALEDKDIRNVLAVKLSNYPRPIPKGSSKKIKNAKKVFDDIVILYTDYTGKDRKHVEEGRKEKDPIAFGILKSEFKNPITNRKQTVQHTQAFFITDWVDDDCDLTLDKLISEAVKVEKPINQGDLTKVASVEEVNELFSSVIPNGDDNADKKLVKVNI